MIWRISAALVLTAMAPVGAQQAQIPVRVPDRDVIGFPTSERPPTRGVIIGTVIDADSGRGIPHAVVRLAGDGGSFAMKTDPLGRYYFVDLPPGDHIITVERPGFVPGEFGKLRPDGSGHALLLRPGEWRVDGDIALWRTAVISGYVGNEIGEPVVGVRVQAMRSEYVEGTMRIAEIHTELTDDRGEFRIGGLMPGNYLVMTPSVQVTVPIASLERVANSGSATAGIINLMSLGGMIDAPGGLGRIFDTMVYDDEDLRVQMGATLAIPPGPRDGQLQVYPTQY